MREILEKLINEEISIEECERLLKADTILEFDEVAKFDKSRSSRTGFPEAVFSPSKDYGDLLLIINNYFTSENPENLIVTKLSSERYEKLADDLDLEGFELDYNKRAQILVIRNREVPKTLGKVGIITAGTSDINIAEEARVIVEEGGCEAITSYDIGVAGLVDIPVIGVPTSVGYGVGEGGVVALNAMLQSCAPGIAVVNIDNGFGAGVFALTIIKGR